MWEVWSIKEQFLVVNVYSLFKTIIVGPLCPQHSLNFIYSPTFYILGLVIGTIIYFEQLSNLMLV